METDNTYIVSMVDDMNTELDIRERILRAAERLFTTYGYSRVSMDELAAELGMSKKTVYRFFSGKEDLLEQWIDAFYGELSAGAAQIRQGGGLSFAEKLERFAALVGRRIGIVKEPLLQDVRRNAPHAWQHLQALRSSSIQAEFQALLEEGMNSGAVRPDLNPRLVTLVVLAAVEGLAKPETLVEHDTSFPELFKTVIEVVFEGVLTESGRLQRRKA